MDAHDRISASLNSASPADSRGSRWSLMAGRRNVENACSNNPRVCSVAYDEIAGPKFVLVSRLVKSNCDCSRLTGNPETIESLAAELQMFRLVNFINKVPTSPREDYGARRSCRRSGSCLLSHNTRVQQLAILSARRSARSTQNPRPRLAKNFDASGGKFETQSVEHRDK
jgi:hypothetical protein